MTSIEWTRGDDGTKGETWNPVVGCSLISAGCTNCYAMKFAHRGMRPEHKGLTVLTKHHGPRWNGEVRFVEPALSKPLSWKKPRRIFVNSMSDLFHEGLKNEQIAAVFGVMAACPQHTFQVLTKRPQRMREWFAWLEAHAHAGSVYANAAAKLLPERFFPFASPWPLKNVWLGVSVEDQATADERIPELLETPAAIRFVSYEPALGEVDFGMSSATCDCCPRWTSRWVRLPHPVKADLPELDAAFRGVSQGLYRAESNRHGALSVRTRDGRPLGIRPAEFECLPKLDWIIVGGESGAGAREFDLAWMRSAIEQCETAEIACFCKQLGAKPVERAIAPGHPSRPVTLRDRKGGDMSEWPQQLRVREFPT